MSHIFTYFSADYNSKKEKKYRYIIFFNILENWLKFYEIFGTIFDQEKSFFRYITTKCKSM